MKTMMRMEANAQAQVSKASRASRASRADCGLVCYNVGGAQAAARKNAGGKRKSRAVRARAAENDRKVTAAAAATTPETATGTSAGKDNECYGVFCLTYDISKVRVPPHTQARARAGRREAAMIPCAPRWRVTLAMSRLASRRGALLSTASPPN